ncbi:MAG: cation:proton antiporter [Deltaproteobacteria bacterium]|nr:cation:proton antiporter [Deltaproteobacteria bacterium]
MSQGAFYATSVALAAGLLAQLLAARLALPSLVLLLLAGVLVGPDGFGWIDPRVFGGGRADIVALAVTVILFEGGLSLNAERIRRHRRVLLLLLLVGGPLSCSAGALAAHLFLAMPWSTAALYGALMIVTGPTVVTPLVSRLKISRETREILIGEGVLIDPVGAIIALVAAEWVVGEVHALASGWLVVARLGVGAALGALAGRLTAEVLRRRWVRQELEHALVLAGAVAVAGLASRLSAEAGLMSAVVQGVVLGNAPVYGMQRLREFKETLTIVLLSFLFVVLAADVRIGDCRALGWPGLAVIGVLVWVARPLAVAIATAGSELSAGERAFVAWICPRGIVAASVAGIFRQQLDAAGVPGGRELEALVFLTVALTVAVQGLSAGAVVRALRIDLPRLHGVVIVGADQLGRTLGRLLARYGRQVVLLDRNPAHCARARADALPAYLGDALSLEALEESGVRYADSVVALSRNLELNELVTRRVHENFRIERLLGLTEPPPAPPADAESPPAPFPGAFPGVDEVNDQLRHARARLAAYDVPAGSAAIGQPLAALPYADGEFALARARGEGIEVAASDDVLAAGDRLWCVRPRVGEPGLAALLRPVGDGELSPRAAIT